MTVEGGRGVARELRKSDAKLGAEEVWNSGSTVSSSSPAFGWPVAAFWGRELVRERGDWVAGLPQVLKRARDGEPGLFPELATATARWRPRSSTGVAWRGEEGSSAGWSGARRLRGCRVWRWSSRRWPAALLGGGRRRSAPAAEEAERERGGRRELDYFAISEKFRDPIIKQK